MVYIHVDTSEVEHELDRLMGAPDVELVGKLDAVMALKFARSQAQVHVVTGSLKRSGDWSNKVRPGRWEGEISYGGPSRGSVHNPVTYAGEEIDKGGFHDFMEPVLESDAEFGDSIMNFLADG